MPHFDHLGRNPGGLIVDHVSELVGQRALSGIAGGVDSVTEHDVLAGGSFGGGYGTFAGNNTIFVFGGGGSPSDQGRSGLLGEADCAVPGPLCFPDLLNLNAGFTQAVARFLHASTAEGAFIYLLGGETNTELATASTERTNL